MIHTLLCEVPVLPQPATRLPSCVIKQVTFSELSNDSKFDDLVRQYEEEALVPGFPEADLQFGQYRMMEVNGNFHMIAAYKNSELVGFVTIVMSVLPHSGKRFGSLESFFVAQEHRKHGPGFELLRAAEWLASQPVGLYDMQDVLGLKSLT